MTDCVFCRIVAGELPARVIYDDGTAIAFLDHRPAARGHALVVPRHHVTHLWDASGDDAAAIGRAVHTVAALLRDRLGPDGLTMRQNTGEASGQDVMHLHVHLVPRWHGDGHIGWPSPPPDPSCVDEVLALLTR
ncbi:MAG TPA: HIT family protein [Mycobacteriales bacterium]|nr:HIT family protein [Mycobacteriales bacterium]